MHRITPFALLILLLASCAGDNAADSRHVDEIRAEVEQLVQEQARMGYATWVFGTPSNQDSLYRLHASLFTRENLDLIRRVEGAEPDALQKRRLRWLLRYLTLEFVAREAAPLADSLATAEAQAEVTFDGRRIPYFAVSGLLANEPRPARRAALSAAADPVLDSLNRLRRAIWVSHHRVARDLGYPSYSGMIEELRGLPLASMQTMAAGVLTTTDSLYRALLSDVLRSSLGVDTSSFYRYDTPRLFRADRFDRFFPKSRLIESAESLYAAMGIRMGAQTNLAIDTVDRPGKNPRAVCFVIRVPDDIRLSVKPTGGPDDFAALLHELGHGQHYAHTTEHALEFKVLGEPTVTETYAFLSEYLLLNPAWLRQHSGMPVATLKDFVRLNAFSRLFYVRRYCAKFLYESAFHAGASRPDTLYSSMLARALGYRRIASDDRRHLADMDEHYYAAAYLRAWFLESQLNAHLSRTYGVNWFEDPAAGAFLRSLWARGDRLTGEDLAALIGHPAITPEAWIAELRDMIRLSSR